jgi:hypothetical protein
MSYPPNMIEQVAVLRHRELIEETARSRRTPRKRFRLLALASAAGRSVARQNRPARPPAAGTNSRPVIAS